MCKAAFQSASPYQDDVLALPVDNLDVASQWYCQHFGMTEVERRDDPHRAVVLARDGVQIGFAENGGDPSQDGAAIRVHDIESIKAELVANGVAAGDSKTEVRDGEKFRVFFVVAPDGLCYYFHQLIEG